jgi:hypothetical protein
VARRRLEQVGRKQRRPEREQNHRRRLGLLNPQSNPHSMDSKRTLRTMESRQRNSLRQMSCWPVDPVGYHLHAWKGAEQIPK